MESDTPMPIEVLRELLRAEGLEVFGYIRAEEISLEEDSRDLAKWQSSGRAGEMSYMLRPTELFANPSRLLPALRSAVLVAAPYEAIRVPPAPSSSCGRVARYAWGLDYHDVLRGRLKAVVRRTEARLSRKVKARVFSDAVPTLERALARSAGLGFQGKNTMLIRPRGDGSFFFIAEIFWDVALEQELPPNFASSRSPGLAQIGQRANRQSGCGTCRRCLDACPTNALLDEFRLDARRCISYLTIEKRGFLAPEEREMVGPWIFGCDICQEVCPFNHQALQAKSSPGLPEFRASAGVGPWLNLAEVLSMRSEADFVSRFGKSALRRAGRIQLMRNAAVVAANLGAEELLPKLREAFEEQQSDMVRRHALGAYLKICEQTGALRRSGMEAILERARLDPSVEVQQEYALWMESHD